MKHAIRPTRQHLAALVAASLIGTTFAAYAERMPVDRKTATHVLTGKVAKITKGGDRRITVHIDVADVGRGEGVEPGQTIETLIFGPPAIKKVDEKSAEFKALSEEGKTKVRAEALLSHLTFSAHKSPPEVGQSVRVYLVKRDNGRWEGLYRDWYDLVD